MKLYYKIPVVLLISLILIMFIGCTGDDDKEIDCEACIRVQIALCEELGTNNCKPTKETDELKQKVIDLCPDGEGKAKLVQLRCWRANAEECSIQEFNCK